MKRELFNALHALGDGVLMLLLWKEGIPLFFPWEALLVSFVGVGWRVTQRAYTSMRKHLRPFHAWGMAASGPTSALFVLILVRGITDGGGLTTLTYKEMILWGLLTTGSIGLFAELLGGIYRMWVRGRGIVSQVWWVGEKSAGKELKGLLSLRFTGLDFLTFSPKEGIQDELRKRLLGKRIHLLLLDHSLSWEQARAIRHAGQRRGIPVRTLPRLEGTLFLSVDEVGIPLWGERLSVGTLPARIAKRLFDFLVGLPMLLVLILPALVVAFLIWVVDKNPPLYSHRRMGRSGRPFLLLKFRSMRPIPLEKLLEENPKLAGEFSKTHKLENDPRITPLGAFLRKWSVDEWPQLVNIILGDMSVVGPRPVVEAELARYGDWQDLLLTVKPGLTGLWQVSGRSRLSYDARVRLDTWYVQNWSPWQDLRILFLTLPAVLTRRGAV